MKASRMLLASHDCNKTFSLAVCMLTSICHRIRCLGPTPNAKRSSLLHRPCQMVCRDMASGSDSWAVKQGWVSITPLGLRSDIIVSQVIALRTYQICQHLISSLSLLHITLWPILGIRPRKHYKMPHGLSESCLQHCSKKLVTCARQLLQPHLHHACTLSSFADSSLNQDELPIGHACCEL